MPTQVHRKSLAIMFLDLTFFKSVGKLKAQILVSWNKKKTIHPIFLLYLPYILKDDAVSDDDFSYLHSPFMFSWFKFHFRGDHTSKDRYVTELTNAKF